jgi:GNAT superfamily N-acetyltransferase
MLTLSQVQPVSTELENPDIPPQPVLSGMAYLPGRFVLRTGSRGDYLQLARFHYLPKPPATWAKVLCVHHIDTICDAEVDRLAAVAVMSWPVPMLRARRSHLRLSHLNYAESIRFANQHIRTLSRVVVHPHYRALGLATRLAREMTRICPVRYLESSARMGDYSPFLVRAGLTQVSPSVGDHPAYFLFDALESGRA